MNKSKKLPEGIPVVDSNGTVTPLSMAELAKQIGKELGVQRAAYRISAKGWYRIAEIPYDDVSILRISNTYNTAAPSGIIVAIAPGFAPKYAKISTIIGDSDLFPKLRLVRKTERGSNVFVDVFYNSSSMNECFLSMDWAKARNKEEFKLCELATEATVAADEGSVEYEITKSGGVKPYVSIGCKIEKGGSPYERENESPDRRTASGHDARSNGVSRNLRRSRQLKWMGHLVDECTDTMRESSGSVSQSLEVRDCRSLKARHCSLSKTHMPRRLSISVNYRRRDNGLENALVDRRKEVVFA